MEVNRGKNKGDWFCFPKVVHSTPFSKIRKRGQALVEAVIVVPALILLVLLIIDIGRMIYTKIVITNAAREGAYFLSYHPDQPLGVGPVVLAEAQSSGVPPASITVDPPSCVPSPCASDSLVTVSVRAAFNGIMFRNIILIANSVQMMVVQ